MNKLSTSKRTLLALAIFALSYAISFGFELPVKGKVDLSSNFCEYRPAHFHGGIDIRTGGKEGRKVYSPVDGYIWRIKYSYNGYGKGLYLKDYEGYTYVFGHLSRLNDKLERIVWDHQLENRVYSFDNVYERDSIPVKIGDLIAFSGKTGIGAPHIHFEVRNPNNKPLNPQTNGFEIIDRTPPIIEFVSFAYQDDSLVFPNGARRYNKKPIYNKSRQAYVLKSPMPLRGPFGIRVKTFDQIRKNGPDLNIYKARLFIDDYIYYETIYENYDFAETGMTDLCFDYQTAVEKDQYWHQLFIPKGKIFSGDKSLYKNGGIFDINSEIDYGLHRARIELYDAAGNKTELKFEFVMIPPGPLFKPVWVDDTTCYMENRIDNKYIDLEKIQVFASTGKVKWKKIEPNKLDKRHSGDYQFTIPSGKRKPDAIKVKAIGESGWSLSDNHFVLKKPTNVKYTFDYKLIDGGFLFNISTRRKIVEPPKVVITYDDGYFKELITSPAGDGRYAAFFKNSEIKSTAIRFDLIENGTDFPLMTKDVSISLAGNSPDRSVISELDNLSVKCGNNSFYSPVNIELKKQRKRFAHNKSIQGSVYSVGPKTIPLAANIELSFVLSNPKQNNIGVYRLNKKGKWKWLKHSKTSNGIKAETRYLGNFAVIEDKYSPRVKKIYPGDGKTVKTTYPHISFKVIEDLSGIHNHKNIQVFLDDRWLIPEYDTDTELVKTYPEERISEGRHDLKIIVTDRVGNSRTVQTHFYVKSKKN
ncbi:MAG: M23 family metallopeptidase [candidate division Zixibacteria bacterium]|nr:M23 family metallopeptidase [candidate division Zixibacteria bacterium]